MTTAAQKQLMNKQAAERRELAKLMRESEVATWTCSECGASFPRRVSDDPNGRCSQCVVVATLRAQLAEAQKREEIKDAAIAKALAIHDRYCDRVGVADSSWAGTVHAALRDAAALALAATRGREG